MHASSADGAWLELGANQGSGHLCPGTTGIEILCGDVAQDLSYLNNLQSSMEV